VSFSLVVIRIKNGSTSLGFSREMTSGGLGESDLVTFSEAFLFG
jgi:hypothetical protein